MEILAHSRHFQATLHLRLTPLSEVQESLNVPTALVQDDPTAAKRKRKKTSFSLDHGSLSGVRSGV